MSETKLSDLAFSIMSDIRLKLTQAELDSIRVRLRMVEQAAEIRGAERMRERCVEAIEAIQKEWESKADFDSDNAFMRENARIYSKMFAAANRIATALAALPSEHVGE